MNPRLKRAYQSYIEKFGEQPPKPYMSTLTRRSHQPTYQNKHKIL